MLVEDVVTDAKTGETTRRWINIPDADFAAAQAQQVADAQQAANGKTMEQQADTALANLRAYRDNANPTNAQTVAVIKTLCRVAIALIRLRLAKLDATD